MVDIVEFRFKELVEGLKLLASPFDVQVKALPDFVHVPDEVINAAPPDSWEFLMDEGRLTKEQLHALWKFDHLLSHLDGPSDYESQMQEFRSGEKIEHIRGEARSLLSLLGLEWSEPVLDHFYWMKAG